MFFVRQKIICPESVGKKCPADIWAFFTSLIIVYIKIDGRELTAPNSIKFVTGVEGGPNVRTSV